MCLDAAAARRLHGPDTVDGVGPTQDWEAYWKALAERRRANAPWVAPKAPKAA